jgi:DNA processing protein
VTGACDDCLRRTDLVAALAAWLDIEWRRREAPGWVLARPDDVLLDPCGLPEVHARYERFDPDAAREAVRDAGLPCTSSKDR